MQLNPYLLFNGRCEEAFKFYEQVFGGKMIRMQTHGNSPMAQNVSAEWKSKILHAHLEVAGGALMGSDAPPEHYQKPQGMSVSVSIEDPGETDRVFQALSAGATVQMPIQQTFWSVRFGMLVDRFGIPWIINCTKAA